MLQNTTSPQGIIQLRGTSAVNVVNDSRKFGFDVVTPSRVYLLVRQRDDRLSSVHTSRITGWVHAVVVKVCACLRLCVPACVRLCVCALFLPSAMTWHDASGPFRHWCSGIGCGVRGGQGYVGAEHSSVHRPGGRRACPRDRGGGANTLRSNSHCR